MLKKEMTVKENQEKKGSNGGKINFTLRLPLTLDAKLRAAARSQRCSRQSQIVHLLEQIFETPAGGKKEQMR